MSEQMGFALDSEDEPMSEGEARLYLQRINHASQTLLIHVATFKRKKGYKVLGYDNLIDCIRSECPAFADNAPNTIYKLAMAGEVLEHLSESVQFAHSPISESQLRPIVRAKLQPAQQVEVWKRAVESAPEGKVTGAHVSAIVVAYQQELRVEKGISTTSKQFYTVEEWDGFTSEQQSLILGSPSGNSKFNRQVSDSIEWAQWSWNPITGCLHNCPYCYARDIAQDKYTWLDLDKRFLPTFFPDRLNAPFNTRPPSLEAIEDSVQRVGLRNVFTCSMADLFGKWVPPSWIEAVLQQIADHPEWTFLLLTKFPIRMAEFDFPPNTWIGTSVDRQYAVERAEKAFRKIRAGGYSGVAWLSCEPMMERLTFTSLDMFDWLVMGGASWSSQTPTYFPPARDTIHLVNQADKIGIPIYMKTNLGIVNESRIRDYPNALVS